MSKARLRKGRAVTGVVLLNKPQGMSSNHALQRVKRLYNAQKPVILVRWILWQPVFCQFVWERRRSFRNICWMPIKPTGLKLRWGKNNHQ